MISRREAMKRSGALLGAARLQAQEKNLGVAGRAAELAVTAATPQTVRITIQPLDNGQPIPIPDDGALVKQSWGEPAIRLRGFYGSRRVKCGNLLVTVSAEPLSIRVETRDKRLVQEIKLDA